MIILESIQKMNQKSPLCQLKYYILRIQNDFKNNKNYYQGGVSVFKDLYFGDTMKKVGVWLLKMDVYIFCERQAIFVEGMEKKWYTVTVYNDKEPADITILHCRAIL